ncbi:MAG TPA: exosortase E/protease, VPEID-CTERM system, partial [Steroidobacteraceae bacterium]|nr:exosortase E/protease, VPEID-CTERM system [Steroidobacteraceae bacterium]
TVSVTHSVRFRKSLAAPGGAHASLGARAALLLLVLFAEKFGLNFFINTQSADTARGSGAMVRLIQHIGFRFAVPFALALALFILVDRDGALERVDSEARSAGFRARWLTVHLALLLALAGSLTLWYSRGGIRLPLVGISIVIASAAVIALLAGLAPLALWKRSAAALGVRWAYAAAAAALASALFTFSQQLWGSTAQLTFHVVRLLLVPVLPSLHADAARRILETSHFAIYVAPYCSGLEGIALMIVFSCAWLLYFRREYVFPRALMLIPAGILVIFGLNALRIAALMLIGNAGYPGIALYGFHSQAGWIAFNCAACGIAFASRHSRWLNRNAGRDTAAREENPAAAYLMPFLAILAAGMLSRAASSGFETWYALRLIAAVAALAIWRRPLRRLDWRFGWRGIAAGLAVFALWLGASHLILDPRAMPGPLAAMTPAARDLWIAARALTGVLLVPIAEELAYRGYLMRRLLAEDFESVAFGSVTWIPLLVTAVAFGALHGALWLPAIAAGVVYGLVLMRTGRMGEAVAAHATSNLLIAAWVLGAGHWQLW